MKLKFFKSKVTGEVITKAYCQGAALPSDFEELEAGVTDAALEKHVPVVTVGDVIHVEVGSVTHPMEDEHYITFIALETTQGVQIKKLHPGQAPAADFTVVAGEEPVAVYEYCNLHGLWKAEI